MKKMNKTYKQEIKKKIIKGVNILCYILSVLFVILMVVVGIQSCHKQPVSQSAEEEYSLTMPKKQLGLVDYKFEGQYSYVLKHEVGITFEISLDAQSNLAQRDLSLVVTQSSPSFETEYYLENAYVCLEDGTLYQIDRFVCKFESMHNVYTDIYYYRLTDIGCRYNGSTHWFVAKDNTNAMAYIFRVSHNYFKIVLNEDSNLYLLELLFYKETITSFVFNKDFNFNAPIGLTNQAQYGAGGVWTSSTSDTAYKDYDVGYFVSNGGLYNKIRVYFWSTTASYYDLDGNKVLGPEGQWSYSFMYYMNTDTNVMISVNQREQLPFQPSSNTYGYYYTLNSLWSNDSFRYVYFLTEKILTDDTLRFSINAFNNNNQTQTSGYVGSADVTNVFTLVGSAFTGLLPILSMYILPGITIGTLMFIPLVATLVFVIIKVIKK